MRNLFYSFITFALFLIQNILSVNIEIEIVNNGGNNRGGPRLMQVGQPFNPFDQFLNMNSIAQQMMGNFLTTNFILF
jgi:hypothetical protein